MSKTIKLVWNVIVYNVNKDKIEVWNVFNHTSFMDDVTKIFNKHKKDKEKFVEELRRSLMYYYWSKCEWEILVTPLFAHKDDEEKKVDVYWQVYNNWDVFIEYTWNSLHKQWFNQEA